MRATKLIDNRLERAGWPSSALVVAPVVAVVALPPAVGRDDGIFGDGGGKGSVPWATILELQPLDKATPKPKDQGNRDGYSDQPADENEGPMQLNIHHIGKGLKQA